MQKAAGTDAGVRMSPARYDEVARALGCFGVRVRRPDELEPALAAAMASGRPGRRAGRGRPGRERAAPGSRRLRRDVRRDHDLRASVSDRSVGVTGAAGFVGRALTARFRADGWEVVAIDRVGRRRRASSAMSGCRGTGRIGSAAVRSWCTRPRSSPRLHRGTTRGWPTSSAPVTWSRRSGPGASPGALLLGRGVLAAQARTRSTRRSRSDRPAAPTATRRSRRSRWCSPRWPAMASTPWSSGRATCTAPVRGPGPSSRWRRCGPAVSSSPPTAGGSSTSCSSTTSWMRCSHAATTVSPAGRIYNVVAGTPLDGGDVLRRVRHRAGAATPAHDDHGAGPAARRGGGPVDRGRGGSRRSWGPVRWPCWPRPDRCRRLGPRASWAGSRSAARRGDAPHGRGAAGRGLLPARGSS